MEKPMGAVGSLKILYPVRFGTKDVDYRAAILNKDEQVKNLNIAVQDWNVLKLGTHKERIISGLELKSR